MKKLFLLSLVIFIAAISNAQIKVQKDKILGYVPINDFPEANFTAAPEAFKYALSFDQAIAKPGKKILVDSFRVVNTKIFFKKPFDVTRIFIVYNYEENNINLIKDIPNKRDDTFYLVLFGAISIFLMILSGVLSRYRIISNMVMIINVFLVAIIALNSAHLALFGLISNTINITSFVSCFSAIIAGIFSSLASIALASKDQEKYKRIVIIFYVLMSVHIVLMFI